jgi:DNA repair protein RadA/Sms
MAKPKITSSFLCTSCGYSQARWLGRCPECGEWNTFVETAVAKKGVPGSGISQAVRPVPLSAVDPMEGSRVCTGIGEFDRVLGSGAMMRSAILIGGEPGIGKSTLLLQVSAAVCREVPHARALYVSGEESAAQIRARADRLGMDTSGIEIL